MGGSSGCVVVGAGPAGLAAANALAARGIPVTVLEAGDDVGGRTRTVDAHGCVLNTGATFFTSFYPQTLRLCRRLGVPLVRPELHPARSGELRHLVTPAGTMPYAPGRPLELMRFPLVPAAQKARLAAAVARLLLRRGPHVADPRSLARRDDGEDAAAWARRTIGDEACDYLVRHAIEPFFFMQASEVSATVAHALLRHSAAWTLLTPERGVGAFAGALAHGVDVRPGAPVARVERRAGGYRVHHRHGAEDCRAVVLAVPAPAVLSIDPPLAPADRAALEAVRYVPCVKLLLGYERELRLSPPTLTPGGPGRHALVGVRALSRAGTPGQIAPGKEVVSVLAMGWRSRELLARPDGEIVEALLDDARALGADLPAPGWKVLVRHAEATVVPGPGYYRRLDALAARGRTGVHLAGDWLAGMSTVEGSVRTGLGAAAAVAEELAA